MRVPESFQSLQESPDEQSQNSRKNARLTQLGRVHLMHQIAVIGLEAAADRVGISKRRAMHMDMRKLARFDRPGHRLTGDPTPGSPALLGSMPCMWPSTILGMAD